MKCSKCRQKNCKPDKRRCCTGPTGASFDLTVEVTQGATGPVLSSAQIGPGDNMIFWSETLDIVVSQGSAIINIENKSVGNVGLTGPY